uniref:Uncharacterized protein n=1 Tax=Ficus carica TaxID=3494 RepID=A0AA88JH08_FICCA|nr:hypothetical protein TIFTF001_055984 [Ficus carica]GMN71961.1 hypothetical protein TIFTF001_055985 [Ficus carica]
MWDGHRHVF